jgi:hypothetical protein
MFDAAKIGIIIETSKEKHKKSLKQAKGASEKSIYFVAFD